jgi:hypothetical protein
MEARKRAEDAIYRRASSRLDPQFQQREAAMRTQLINQGLDPQSEAFQAEMGAFNRGRNDAYQGALDASIMGGGDEKQINAIDRAAAEFGLAFQIVDDVLDVEGESADLGKTAGKDAAAGKPTYPSLFGVEASRRMAAECLQRAEAALAGAGIADSHLLGLGRWIVERSN